MIYLNKSDFSLVHDLNRFLDLGHAWQISSTVGRHALGSTRLCASHNLFASEGIQSHGSGQAYQHKVKDFSCLDQFLALSFAQMNARESLGDIEINFRCYLTL